MVHLINSSKLSKVFSQAAGCLAVLLLALATGFSGTVAALDKPTIGTAIAGRHYEILPEFGKTKVPPGKVEVTEYFWYGCPHCYKMEDYVEEFQASKPPYVTFRQVAVPFRGLWQLHAQSYYTAEKLGIAKQSHRAFFDAIHKHREPLTTQRAIAKFYTQYGVSADKFSEVYNSFGVESKMRLALREVEFYKINSVPMFIVNGKYKVSSATAGSEANIWEVIRQLAKLEFDAGKSGQGGNQPSS